MQSVSVQIVGGQSLLTSQEKDLLIVALMGTIDGLLPGIKDNFTFSEIMNLPGNGQLKYLVSKHKQFKLLTERIDLK